MTGAMDTVLETGGGIGGSIIGGAGGTLLCGPICGYIGRAVGSQVGKMAGRAAAGWIASQMEQADLNADAKTKDQAAAVPCQDCQDVGCFKPPAGSTQKEIDEFKRQLEEQQKAINDIPPDKLLENMDTYEKIGRGTEDAVQRALARDNWLQNKISKLLAEDSTLTKDAAKIAAEKQLKTMDVIHTPDLSAGGTGKFSEHNGGLAPRGPNRSIGSQWSKASPGSSQTRLEELRKHAEEAKQKGKKTNVKLKLCDEKGKPEDGGGGSNDATPTPQNPDPGNSMENIPTS